MAYQPVFVVAAPLLVVAPGPTSRTLLRAALFKLASEPLRVLAHVHMLCDVDFQPKLLDLRVT